MRYSPRKVVVLGAIQGNGKKFDKIRKISKMDPQELNSVLEELERDGMIEVIEKKGLFGKKIEIRSTQAGTRELEASLREAESKWGEMKLLYERKDKDGLKGFMDDNRSFLPMMMFFGVMDMMMFSMMFSMMGASMGSYVPAEDVPSGAEDAGGQDAGGQDYSDPGVDGGGFDFDMGF